MINTRQGESTGERGTCCTCTIYLSDHHSTKRVGHGKVTVLEDELDPLPCRVVSDLSDLHLGPLLVRHLELGNRRGESRVCAAVLRCDVCCGCGCVACAQACRLAARVNLLVVRWWCGVVWWKLATSTRFYAATTRPPHGHVRRHGHTCTRPHVHTHAATVHTHTNTHTHLTQAPFIHLFPPFCQASSLQPNTQQPTAGVGERLRLTDQSRKTPYTNTRGATQLVTLATAATEGGDGTPVLQYL